MKKVPQSQEFPVTRRALLLASSTTAAATIFPGMAYAQSLKLRVGFTAISEYTGLFIGKDRGFFQKRGLDVEPVLIANNATIPAALISDSVQIGTPSITTTLQSVDGGLPLQIVAGAGVLSASAPVVGLVVKAGSNIRTAADLHGKKVGVPGLNALFHVIARQWITKNGGNVKQIQFVETPFAQMFDLLKGGTVDAVMAAEPARSRIVAAQIGTVLGNTLDAIMDPALSGNYVATASFVQANKKAVLSFREALEEAHQYARTNPDAAYESQNRYLKLPLDLLKTLPTPILRSKVDREQVQYWIGVAKEQEMLRGDVKADTLLPTLM
jgi:NitT/TauT family transport system substrate-binding protein